MGAAGRAFAAGYDWDVLAAQQAQVYRDAAVTIPAGRPAGAVRS